MFNSNNNIHNYSYFYYQCSSPSGAPEPVSTSSSGYNWLTDKLTGPSLAPYLLPVGRHQLEGLTAYPTYWLYRKLLPSELLSGSHASFATIHIETTFTDSGQGNKVTLPSQGRRMKFLWSGTGHRVSMWMVEGKCQQKPSSCFLSPYLVPFSLGHRDQDWSTGLQQL